MSKRAAIRPRAPFGRFVYVSETDESAREELWPTIERLTARLRGFGLFNRKGVVAEADLEPENFYRDMVIVGSPQTCARAFLALHDELGVTYVNALSAFFGFLPLPCWRNRSRCWRVKRGRSSRRRFRRDRGRKRRRLFPSSVGEPQHRRAIEPAHRVAIADLSARPSAISFRREERDARASRLKA